MTSRTDHASDGDVVRTIAALARLDIDEREAAALGRQFQSILKQFNAAFAPMKLSRSDLIRSALQDKVAQLRRQLDKLKG